MSGYVVLVIAASVSMSLLAIGSGIRSFAVQVSESGQDDESDAVNKLKYQRYSCAHIEHPRARQDK
jgi:hypothetical protein